jgi:alcohol dehydrogenase (cytochrome c)/quinohemoprotein ethanol dehydrogenase
MSFDPQTGFVYIPANDIGFVYAAKQGFKMSPIGFNTGYDATYASMPQGDPKVKAAALAGVHGYLRAWDPIAQKEAWSIEHPGPWNGGVLSTAGGLVFQGNAIGAFNAYDAKTGKQLWSAPTQTGVIAAPMSYTVNGEQYIAVLAGWGGAYPITAGDANAKGSIGANRSRVLAFKIGGTAKLPEPPPAPDLQPLKVVGTEAAAKKGFQVFHTYCAVCHGDSAVGGGVIPDLRWSPLVSDAELFKGVVMEGNRKHQGMISFAPVMTASDAEAVRAYVTRRSKQSYDEMQAAKK